MENIDLDLELLHLTEEQSAALGKVLIAAYAGCRLNDYHNDMAAKALIQDRLYGYYCSLDEEQKRIEKNRIEWIGKLFPIF